ncbi:MAG: zinc-binding alcohol dehydrogenase family protein [Bryobacteraceae bacterium]
MKALFIQSPGQTAVREIAEPAATPGHALLRIRMVGMCGSDLNTFRGKNPLVSFPRIPGHEISATIEALGEGAPESLTPGTNVTLLPYTNCGVCPSCKRGRPNACRNNQTLGVQRDGALTELLSVPYGKLRVARTLSLRELAIVEPLTVGFHAAARGRIAAGDIVTVLGCGAVGLGAIAGSAHRGAVTIAVDIDDAKLALARKAGALHTINTSVTPLHEALQPLTGGDGPDVVIEAIGTPKTFRAAVEEVAFTGRVVYIGYAKEEVSYETKYFVQKELDILGSRNATADDFTSVIEMLEKRQFPVEETISRVVPLEDVGGALEAWEASPSSFSKILVEVG